MKNKNLSIWTFLYGINNTKSEEVFSKYPIEMEKDLAVLPP